MTAWHCALPWQCYRTVSRRTAAVNAAYDATSKCNVFVYCVATWCAALRCAATWCACCNKNVEPVLQHSELCCNMMCCAATCCTVLQHGVLCCNMMCCVATGYRLSGNQHKRDRASDTHRSEYSHRVLWVLPQGALGTLGTPTGILRTPTGYSGAHHRLSGGQRGRARGAPAACARARVCTAHTVRPSAMR
jgi:hypothetical protein